MPQKLTPELSTEDFQILIVDDEALICWSLEMVLRKAGYHTRTAANAEDAIRILKQEQFNMVITDLKLPKADGFAVLKQAQKQSPRISAIMMSAYGNPENKEQARKLGAERFLDKPVPIPELLNLAQKISN